MFHRKNTPDVKTLEVIISENITDLLKASLIDDQSYAAMRLLSSMGDNLLAARNRMQSVSQS